VKQKTSNNFEVKTLKYCYLLLLSPLLTLLRIRSHLRVEVITSLVSSRNYWSYPSFPKKSIGVLKTQVNPILRDAEKEAGLDKAAKMISGVYAEGSLKVKTPSKK